MKLGIINSAFYQAGVNTASGLKHISRIGFDCVDVHTEAVDLPKEEIRLVADTCEQLGLPIISLPVCSLGLADFAAPVRDFHIERTKRFIDLARTWGARKDRKSTRLNSSHSQISYAVFCLKKKKVNCLRLFHSLETPSHNS